MKKFLTAYFSHSGNTRAIAEQIQKALGGDLYEIVPEEAYPGNYDACVEQAKKEIADGYQPALKGKLENPDRYEVVFIGSPVWWYTVAPPVATFLRENDFSGKEIAPFCTHGGGGISKCVTDIVRMCPQAAVLEGVAFRGDKAGVSHEELADWLHRIELR